MGFEVSYAALLTGIFLYIIYRIGLVSTTVGAHAKKNVEPAASDPVAEHKACGIPRFSVLPSVHSLQFAALVAGFGAASSMLNASIGARLLITSLVFCAFMVPFSKFAPTCEFSQQSKHKLGADCFRQCSSEGIAHVERGVGAKTISVVPSVASIQLAAIVVASGAAESVGFNKYVVWAGSVLYLLYRCISFCIGGDEAEQKKTEGNSSQANAVQFSVLPSVPSIHVAVVVVVFAVARVTKVQHQPFIASGLLYVFYSIPWFRSADSKKVV